MGPALPAATASVNTLSGLRAGQVQARTGCMQMRQGLHRRACVLGLLMAGAGSRVRASGVPVVGFLRSTPAAPFAHLEDAFRQGLAEGGFVAGQSVTVVSRYADNVPARLPVLAAELLREPVALIVANSQAAEAARLLTRSVPIVFVTSDDPVARGLVQSLGRPGDNLTGITFFGGGQLSGKRVDFLRELLPGMKKLGMLLDPSWPAASLDRSEVLDIAGQRGMAVTLAEASTDPDLEPALQRLRNDGAEGLIVGGCPFFTSRRAVLTRALMTLRLPAIFDVRDFVDGGGLMSYGASLAGAWVEAGLYAARILKGATPAVMPVTRPSQLELVLNQSTARMLGLSIPSALLARADTLVE
jgi:putative ABC transport system substrate-binding protein